MAKKLLIGVTALILILAAIPVLSGFAAEKAKEKMEAAKPEQPKTCEMQKNREGLLDQLIKAYKADDKKAMGEIIAKLEKRREQMRKFAQFERWHQMAHRRMMQRGWGQQQGWQRGGGCCPGMQMNQNWGPPAGGFRPMPQWRHPGGFGPAPQWNRGPQQPNEQATPPPANPGAMWNDDDQTPDSDNISALDDDDMFTGPDDEIAMNNDSSADSEW
ncbi:MAG: hypothetical protein ABSH16_00665 [Sedimentisphaerales bacterium]